MEWMPGRQSNRWANPIHGDEQFETANEEGLERGRQYLRKITARGGTEIDRAIQDGLIAIKGRQSNRALPIMVILTDGEVGDESRILKRAQTELGDTRVFTVGIDLSVNDGFLRRLAATGGGTSTFVVPGTSLETALQNVSRDRRTSAH